MGVDSARHFRQDACVKLVQGMWVGMACLLAACAGSEGGSCHLSAGPLVAASVVARGPNSTYAILPDGTLWAWGANGSGQLGLGDIDARYTPTQVGSANTWIFVSAGGGYDLQQQFVLALQSDGSLWSWGFNSRGELGQGDFLDRSAPTRVLSVGTGVWNAVGAGADHSVGIQNDGSLWAWGDANNSEIGFGDTTIRPSPTHLLPGTAWQALAIALDITFAIKNDGTLWSWGINGVGQLGQGNTTPLGVPTQVGSATTWSAVAAGEGFNTVANGHGLARQSDGSLWAWGANDQGQLGLPGTANVLSPTRIGSATTWTAIAGGADANLALQSGGSLWAWGVNDSGEIGTGVPGTVTSPAQVGTGTIWTTLASGHAAHHSAAIASDQTLWVWGDGGDGQLGIGCGDSAQAPTRLRNPGQ